MPAVRDALSVPELLTTILDNLASDKTTLKAALLVNRLWADLAADIYWKEPPPSALIALPDARRQYYSSKIHKLEFTAAEGSYHNDFRTLSFPRLESVSMDYVTPEIAAPVGIEQYLQRSLRELVVYGGQLPENFLQLLEWQCPLLETFLLEQWILPQGIQVSENDFIGFLEKMPSLKSVKFIPGLPAAVAPKTFFYLAAREGLEEVEISRLISSQEMESIERTVKGAFSSLLDAVLSLESRAVPMLVRMANQLQLLDLTIMDNDIEILTSIHHLSDLSTLSLLFAATTELSVLSLAGIGRFHDLQILNIDSINHLQCFAFEDDAFERLISQLSGLEILQFQIQCPLTVAALKALGGHCRELNMCELLGSYDVRSLQEVEPPLFPQLEELSIGGALPDASQTPKPLEERAAEMARIIRGHAPKLKELYLTNRDPFSMAIVQAFKEQTGAVYNS